MINYYYTRSIEVINPQGSKEKKPFEHLQYKNYYLVSADKKQITFVNVKDGALYIIQDHTNFYEEYRRCALYCQPGRFHPFSSNIDVVSDFVTTFKDNFRVVLRKYENGVLLYFVNREYGRILENATNILTRKKLIYPERGCPKG